MKSLLLKIKTIFIMSYSKISKVSYTIKQTILSKKHFCIKYLQCFSSNNILIAHQYVYLEIKGMEIIQMPKKGNTTNLLIFKNS